MQSALLALMNDSLHKDSLGDDTNREPLPLCVSRAAGPSAVGEYPKAALRLKLWDCLALPGAWWEGCPVLNCVRLPEVGQLREEVQAGDVNLRVLAHRWHSVQ